MMKIGFIGLGNMGGGMARNLLAHCLNKKYNLCVFDINPRAVDQLAQHGATPCQSPAELTAQVQILFTSLPGAAQINALAFGDRHTAGALTTLPAGAVWFETSTNELPAWKKIIAQTPSHLTLVDAPVTGGAEGAAAGTLTMLLGVDEKDAGVPEMHRELLSAIADNVIRMGGAGAGYVTKLCQLHLNYLAAQGIGEAMMLGAKAELDLAQLHEVLKNSCAQSYVVDRYIPMLLDGSYDPSFALGLATRDMRLINQLGAHLAVELNLGDAVYDEYKTACEKYGDGVPHLSVLKLIEERCGQLLRDAKENKKPK